MSVSFYMDHHVPAAITAGLWRRGVDVITAYEDGAVDFDDPQILERATRLGRALFSQDKDFLVLTHQWLQVGLEFSGLLYAHELDVTIGQAIRDLFLISQALDPADVRNRSEFLPL